MHLLQVFGNVMRLKRESFVNYSVDAVRLSTLQEEEDLEEKSISFSVVIHQLPNHSFCSMCTKLLQEESIHQVRDHLQLVSLFTWQKIQRLRRLFLSLELSSYLIEVFAVLMSLTRWTITQESSCMRQWNNKLSQSPKLVSLLPWMPELLSLQLQIQLNQSMIQSSRLLITSNCHQPCFQDLIWYTWFLTNKVRHLIAVLLIILFLFIQT